jgi:hypothetical protein
MLIASSDHISGLTGATVTVNLSKAGGAGAAAGGTVSQVDATNNPGLYKIALTTTDTNTLGDLAYHCTATSADPTDFIDQVCANILGDTLPANATQINGVATTSVTTINANQGTTQPVNFTGTAGSALVKSDMTDIAGAAVSTTTAQIGVNAVNIGGTAQSGRDLGAGVLVTYGTAAGQINLTGGNLAGAVPSVTGAVGSVTGAVGSVTGNVGGNVTGSVGSVVATVAANLTQILGTALTETAGQIAAAFKQWFNVATPTGTVNSLPNAAPGASGGVLIAGSNAATTVNITGNITGNLSGSVGSVTGAVGSVTGAVGSVTGNVGGSVASVTAPVSITANVKKNTAKAGFMFLMTDSTAHTPKTGLTVTSSRSLDGAAFAATTNAATEVGNGTYVLSLSAADMNGDHVMLRFTATGADDLNIEMITQP